MAASDDVLQDAAAFASCLLSVTMVYAFDAVMTTMSCRIVALIGADA